MKKFLLLVCALSFSVAGRADVRFHEVNPVLQALADAATASDEYVQWSRPSFDPRHSDLLHEKLKYDLKGGMRTTPWSPGRGASVEAFCSLVGERANPRFGIRVTSHQALVSDTLAVFRHGATIALNRAQPSLKFAGRVNDLLQKLRAVKTMAELHSLLVAGQVLAVDILDDEVSHNNGAEWRVLREAYAKTKITTLKQAGRIIGVQIANATTAPGFVARTRLAVVPDSLTLWLVPSRIDGELKGFAPLREAKLDDLRDRLKSKLEELQAGSASAKADTFRVFSDALYEFKRVIQGWL